MNGDNPIKLSDYSNIIILTGAGISVASGIRPFRGKDGLWEDEKTRDLAALSFEDDPIGVWEFWSAFRPEIEAAYPSRVHRHLTELERSLSESSRFMVVTQNIDGLHKKAGSSSVIEIHGNLLRTRCSDRTCAFPAISHDARVLAEPPICPECGSVLRPDIVLFGEDLPLIEYEVKRRLRDCDLFIAVGTSGTVSPASNYVRGAEYSGARCVYINTEPMDPPNPYFHESWIGDAQELVSELLLS